MASYFATIATPRSKQRTPSADYNAHKYWLERQAVPESFERESEENYTGPTNAEGKSVYGHRNANQVIEARRRRLYKHMNNGMSLRQNVYAHADREGVSISTAWRDSEAIKEWYAEDFAAERETIVARLAAARWRAIDGAIRSKNWQSAASLMDSLGRAVGEGLEVEAAQHAPTLNISIEAPGANNKKAAPEDG